MNSLSAVPDVYMHADMVEQLYTAKEEQQPGQYYRTDPNS
jgi:hypothetical protein